MGNNRLGTSAYYALLLSFGVMIRQRNPVHRKPLRGRFSMVS
jgi:hypothetical protein